MKSPNQDHLSRALKMIDSDARGLFVDELTESIEKTVEKAHGRLAHVESAVEMTAQEKEKVQNLLKNLLHKELEFNFRVNPRLLGGFIATVGDWKLDATLIYQLNTMKEALGG